MNHLVKKIIQISIFIIFLALSPALHAEITVVSGRVVNGNGMTIRLMTYADQITYQRVSLAGTTIGEDGRFSLSADLTSVLYGWLDLEFQNADIFLQPGRSYEVELELNDHSLASSYYNRTGIPVKFIKDDSDRLNQSIQDFNVLYNEFLLDYAENTRSLSPRVAYETFGNAIDLRFQQNQNSYFREYIRYKMASLQLYMRIKSRESIGFEYLSGRPVLYDHPEYMDFFHLYFEKYFITGGKYFDYNKSYQMINEGSPASVLLDSLTADPVLKDLALRELLLIDGLKELYNISGFKKPAVTSLLQELESSAAIPESRQLAANLLRRLKRLQPGTPAPEFSLKGVSADGQYQLSDFKGKHVYLAFFESSTPASQAELGLVSGFYEDYRNSVAFVAIAVDKDLSALQEYLSRAELPWLVLHYGGNLDLLEEMLEKANHCEVKTDCAQ